MKDKILDMIHIFILVPVIVVLFTLVDGISVKHRKCYELSITKGYPDYILMNKYKCYGKNELKTEFLGEIK